jgi:ABC-type maltose transport system permease subunit
MLPQAKPIIGIMAIGAFIGGWTDATTSMIYLPDFPTVAYGLYEYEVQMTRQMNYPVYFAGLVLTAIPSIALYITFQDIIMTGMNIGGLKG